MRRPFLAYALLSPAIVAVIFLIAYPLWVAVNVSTREGRTMNIARLDRLPRGWGNFERILDEPANWEALLRSAIYVVGSVLPAFLIGLGLALLLNRAFPARRWIRSLMMLPWAVPGVVTSIAFLWLLDGSYGVVNSILRTLGLMSGDVAWYARQETAMFAVIVPTVWKGFPFFALTLLAAMQAIPHTLYEAARIDGASARDQFRYVTWPGIRGPALLAVILHSLWVFKELDIIFAATGGGPAGATETLALRVYLEAFQFFRLGSASAMGLMMMALCAALVLLALPRLRARFF
ncbi:MAG: sugar ABC transporter permease [Alphaproteobacteria bacterium]|nr:sugar ABC transporter permease [Alphaproteobacteria bacterium]